MLKLFSGTANLKLSEEVSQLLNIPLSQAEIVRFGNSEVKVTIQDDVLNQTCIVIQPTSKPTDTHLMEFCFFCDALKRQEAKKVIGIVPYFGYAKQNIQHREGECVSVNVVIRMMESIGFCKIYTFDIHDEGTGGVFSIPFKNLSAFPVLAQHLSNFCKHEGIDKQSIVLVSPDQGAVEKVRNFGTIFYGTQDFSEAVIEKQRSLTEKHKAKPLDLYGNVKNKIAVIVDDMVVSGSTLLPAADLCLERGAKEVYAAFIHPDFTVDAPSKLQNSKFTRLFTTNTILLKDEEKISKLQQISVAQVIANELKSLI